MSITALRTAIAAQITANAAGCTGHRNVPDGLNERAAIVMFAGADATRLTMGRGSWQPVIDIVIHEPLRGSIPDAEARLDTLIAFTGAASVVAALETDRTFGGTAQDSHVVELGEYRTVQIASNRFVTCTVRLDVIAAG